MKKLIFTLAFLLFASTASAVTLRATWDHPQTVIDGTEAIDGCEVFINIGGNTYVPLPNGAGDAGMATEITFEQTTDFECYFVKCYVDYAIRYYSQGYSNVGCYAVVPSGAATNFEVQEATP